MLGVGDGPPPLTGLDRLIFAPQPPFETAITLGALFVTLFLLLFTEVQSACEDIHCGCKGGLTSVHTL